MDDPIYCILYHDRDKQPEIFMGAGAANFARQRYRNAKDHYTCHLMVEVDDSAPGKQGNSNG